MIHAYDKNYLAAAQKCLARMLDYMVNDLQYPLETVWNWFLMSEISHHFELGDSTYFGRHFRCGACPQGTGTGRGADTYTQGILCV